MNRQEEGLYPVPQFSVEKTDIGEFKGFIRFRSFRLRRPISGSSWMSLKDFIARSRIVFQGANLVRISVGI
jgi:hypothetical protein